MVDAQRDSRLEALEARPLNDVTPLEKLEAYLRRAAEYRNDGDDRRAAIAVISGFEEFVSSFPTWKGEGLQLVVQDVWGALEELDRGHVVPMLKPAKDQGLGGPVFERMVRFRGYSAGVMGGLMKHAGMSKDNAAGWIAERMSAAGIPVTGAKIANWRKDALASDTTLLGKTYLTVVNDQHWQSNPPIVYADALAKGIGKRLPRALMKKFTKG